MGTFPIREDQFLLNEQPFRILYGVLEWLV